MSAVPPLTDRLDAMIDRLTCPARGSCGCERCLPSYLAIAAVAHIAEYSNPIWCLCWELDLALSLHTPEEAAHSFRTLLPALTRDEWAYALAWQPNPRGGGQRLREHLLLHVHLLRE
jgi:hypothetical protein